MNCKSVSILEFDKSDFNTYVKVLKSENSQMSSQIKLKSVLKKPDKLCVKSLKKKVHFNLSERNHKLELLERSNRSKIVNKLLQSDHLQESRSILYHTQLRKAIKYFERKFY